MPASAHKKTHRGDQRPPFECIALLLQGGGALGAYQGGCYEALAEAGIHPDWVAGISIGAITRADGAIRRKCAWRAAAVLGAGHHRRLRADAEPAAPC